MSEMVQEELIHLEDFFEREWQGMPEFNNSKKCARTIIVHFFNEADIEIFQQAVNQKITEKTKYIWFMKNSKKQGKMVYKA